MPFSAESFEQLIRTYLEPLLAGQRDACRQVIEEAISAGNDARSLLNSLIWPTMELIQSLYREDRISISSLNLATRLNRSIADQLCAKLPRGTSKGRKVLIFCGDDEPEELGGQICADLFESDGYEVRFGGGGVPEDEVLKLIGEWRPDLLVMFGTLPSGVPAVRKLTSDLESRSDLTRGEVIDLLNCQTAAGQFPLLVTLVYNSTRLPELEPLGADTRSRLESILRAGLDHLDAYELTAAGFAAAKSISTADQLLDHLNQEIQSAESAYTFSPVHADRTLTHASACSLPPPVPSRRTPSPQEAALSGLTPPSAARTQSTSQSAYLHPGRDRPAAALTSYARERCREPYG